MIRTGTTLNIVRIGCDITYSSLKTIGERLINAFNGIIAGYELAHHDSPFIESIDAQLLTMILQQEIGGHTLGITDADLMTGDKDEFYHTIFGGKNPKNDIAVVSTRKLAPKKITTSSDYELFLDRTIKVSLHEVGHNLGLTDHAAYRTAPDGTLCPMSRGEFNKFGTAGYVRAIIDGRGQMFCDECTNFLQQVYGVKFRTGKFVNGTWIRLEKRNNG